MDVEIELKQGPVHMQSGEDPFERTIDLGSGIVGEERFPGGRSAFYWLRLRKDATHRKAAHPVEKELKETLHLLAHAWPFSGGSILRIEEYVTRIRPLYENSAESVFQEMTQELRLTRVAMSVAASFEIATTYREPPLQAAGELLRATSQDQKTRRMLRNYHAVNVGEDKWWNDLYRTKDELEASYGNRATGVREALGISLDDWRLFEHTSNPGLRHGGDPPLASQAAMRRVRELGRAWIVAHLQRRYALGGP